jgi:hypothetical protein
MLPGNSMADQKNGSAEVDTATWLTCAEASDLLHVSEGTIRSWARDGGRLHPRKGQRVLASGRKATLDLYDPHELAPMGRRGRSPVPSGPGEAAARAFELFDAGRSLRQVVIDLRETPEKVSELHDQWHDLGGCEMVIGGTARAELERFLGPIRDVAELVKRVSDLLGERIEIADPDPVAGAGIAGDPQ